MIPGYDFAFVVYPGKVHDYAFQKEQILSLCDKAGVFNQS
jgi:ribonuclease P protein component